MNSLRLLDLWLLVLGLLGLLPLLLCGLLGGVLFFFCLLLRRRKIFVLIYEVIVKQKRKTLC